ncbi:hypothetical protein IWZ03DRAFT_124835 [Phyllosticta citriasiana]|uniref:Rhodopsin domain-containing protein n=1 Tax=Phyllosticta citriasiana TaxID=595635 RepID=A0ABR1KS48_9PEZI
MGWNAEHQVLVEGIIEWMIAFVFFVGRLWSRVITTGSFKRFALDDYVMIVTFAWYSALLVLLKITAQHGSNLVPDSEVARLLADPLEVKDRIFGSKLTIVIEQCMVHTQWGSKASLLILYHRMTRGLRENIFTKVTAGYILFSYLFIQITFFAAWCRPFSQYWAFPAKNPQCVNYNNYLITILVFNVTSDLLLVAIPIPLIWRARMERGKKAMFYAVFSLGIFNIIAAVLNKAFNWILPGVPVYIIWYVRESSTCIYVANATCCWPLFRRCLTFLGCSHYWTSSHADSTPHARKPDPNIDFDDSNVPRSTRMPPHVRSSTGGGGSRNSTRLSRTMRSFKDKTLHNLTSISVASLSEERICGIDDGSENGDRPVPLEIWRHVEYEIDPGASGMATTTTTTTTATTASKVAVGPTTAPQQYQQQRQGGVGMAVSSGDEEAVVGLEFKEPPYYKEPPLYLGDMGGWSETWVETAAPKTQSKKKGGGGERDQRQGNESKFGGSVSTWLSRSRSRSRSGSG